MDRNTLGHKLNNRTKRIVFNVYEYIRKRKLDVNSIEFKQDIPLNKIVAEYTGLSENAVSRIVQERLLISTMKPEQVRKKKVNVITRGVIRRKVIKFYIQKKKVPTVKTLHALLKEEDVVHCSKDYLRQLLHDIGFKFKRCQSGRLLLLENSTIQFQRWKYLNAIKQYRTEGRNILYVYEADLTKVSKDWQTKTRLTIIHCGGQTGFVDGALSMFTSKKKAGECDEMNFENFSKWINEHLLPNIPQNSVIVMDSASYNSVKEDRKPTMATSKVSMQAWLQRHGVPFNDDLYNSELLQLIKQHFKDDFYKIDKLLETNGHEVLRLPSRHPELNPFELVWGDIKGQIAKPKTSSISDLDKKNITSLFAKYSAENWQHCLNNVIQIEDEYYKHDSIMDDVVDQLIEEQDYSDGGSSESEGSSSDTDM